MLIEQNILESAGNTGVASNWNAWDDFRSHKNMDAPVIVPRGSMICTGSKPGVFLTDTHVLRLGEEDCLFDKPPPYPQSTQVPEVYMTVQFCPSGDLGERSVSWIKEHGGAKQLQRIDSGEKVDPPIFHDSAMDD